MIIFDTDAVVPQRRAQAWIQARADASVPSTVEITEPEGFRGRFEHWRLGEVSASRQTVNCRQRLLRTGQQVQRGGPRTLSVSLQESGTGRHEQFEVQRTVAPGRMVFTDLTAPWEYSFTEGGSVKALLIDLDALNLPPETVRRAVERIEFSPLAGFVTRQIGEVFDQIRTDSSDDGVADLGAGSVDLMRTLLLSASSPSDVRPADRDHRAVLLQIRNFAEQHLADPDLTASRIAAALSIPLETVQEVCARAHVVLDEWIAGRRLERIHEDLDFWSGPGGAAAVAARWGIADPEDFRLRYALRFGHPLP
jgi:hypothetical protein